MYTSRETLLKKPFGCIDEQYLSSGAPNQIELAAVEMYNIPDDPEAPIGVLGLDGVEHLLPPTVPVVPEQKDMHCKVCVTGVFVLEDLDWFSNEGLAQLTTLVRARDNEYKKPGDPNSAITLQSLYVELEDSGDPELLRVRITFIKGVVAYGFKKEDSLREGRYIDMKSKFRIQQNYEVLSFRADCYFKSMGWEYWYQLFHLMKDLASHSEDKIKKRTIEWFIQEYMKHYLEQDKYRRIISRPNDPNVNPDGTLKKPQRLRKVRKVPSAEIRGRFAEHCEWLLANQIVSSAPDMQVFNLAEWVKFCDAVQEWRKLAKELDGEKWGIAYGTPEDLVFPEDDPYFLQRFGGTAAEWKEKLDLALKREQAELSKEDKEDNEDNEETESNH